jgi:hypothetical protein
MKSDDHDAEEGLSFAPKRDASGEERILVETGNTAAEGAPSGDQPKRRFLGSAAGEFTVPDDFNDPLPKEIEDLFW